jgi:hypothetical protein
MALIYFLSLITFLAIVGIIWVAIQLHKKDIKAAKK